MSIEPASEEARAGGDDAEARARRRWSRALLGSAVALLLMLLWLGILAGQPRTSISGEPAPPFDLALLTEDGRVSEADVAGRVVVVNVFASWCAPCREEAPILRRVHAGADPTQVAFLGVAHTDRREDALEFVEDFDLEFPAVLDDGSFGQAYGVRGLPMTFVIDASGRVTATHFGPIGESRLNALIEDAVGRGAGAAR